MILRNGQPYEVDKLLIQLLDRYGLTLEYVEEMAADILEKNLNLHDR